MAYIYVTKGFLEDERAFQALTDNYIISNQQKIDSHTYRFEIDGEDIPDEDVQVIIYFQETEEGIKSTVELAEDA